MNKLLFRFGAFLILTTTAGVAVSGTAPEGNRYRLQISEYLCRRAGGNIVVDGALTDPVWENAERIVLADIKTGETPEHESWAKMLWDEEYLYIGFNIMESNLQGFCRDDGVKFSLDTRENFCKVYLDPDDDGIDHIKFDISILNAVFNVRIKEGYDSKKIAKWPDLTAPDNYNDKWTCPGLKSAVRHRGTLNKPGDSDSGWSAEIAIPFASLRKFGADSPPNTGDVWRMHLGRRTAAMEKKQDNRFLYLTWPVIGAVNSHLLSRWGFVRFSDAGKGLKWKLVWVWNMQGKTDADIEEAVSQAKSLGFNAIAWNPPNRKHLVEYCREHGVESYYVIGFNTRQKEGIQVLAPDEIVLPSSLKEKKDYQSGGEPLNDSREVLHSDVYCLRSPVALTYAWSSIQEGISAGYDGIAFDFIGYKNYRRCNCPACLARLQEYIGEHPGIPVNEASNHLSREDIVWFYEQLVKYAKSLNPDIKTTCHVYPVFLPDILYGNRLAVDYCGQTVSWAYEPYWDYDKIHRYTQVVVDNQDKYHPGSLGAPFIACHAKNFRKSSERIRKEIQVVRQAGAQAFQMTELGNILSAPEIAEAVKAELAPANAK